MENYKIISCAGFGYTGSSIVSDYLAEFDNVDVRAGSAEFRFLHDFGGISTLEDCIVHNYHKQSSDAAIHLYLQMVSYLSGNFFAKKYNSWFKGEFRKLSEDFINDITDARWKGFVEPTAMFKPTLWRILYYQIYPRLKRLFHGGGNIGAFYPKQDMYFSSPDKDYFDECVKKYLNNLFMIIDPLHEKEFLYFDQIVPPSNVNRYLDYFNDIKVIVVDRDPRDIFIQNTYKIKESWIPFDVDTFIKMYRGQRKNIKREEDNRNILRIRFEDAIYRYDEFSKQVASLVGLQESNHTCPKSLFDPSRSIRNTRLWEKYNVNMNDIKKIEEQLSEYCYDYSNF